MSFGDDTLDPSNAPCCDTLIVNKINEIYQAGKMKTEIEALDAEVRGIAPPRFNPLTGRMEGGCTPYEPHYPAPSVYKEEHNDPTVWDEIVDTMKQNDDPVNHPKHYTKGKIEVADFIADQGLNFDRGNAVKYICRAGDKPDSVMTLAEKEIQDLEKAVWYINHEIKVLKERNGISG